MIELGVNIDHVATLRQQRHTVYPDPVEAAVRAEDAGADVITLHLREDRRHIQDADVYAIRPKLRTRMNLECALTPEMLEIACAVKPDDVCLVPEKRAELTTEGGLDVLGQFEAVADAVALLAAAGIRVSLFIDPDAAQIEAAARAKRRSSNCIPAPMPRPRARRPSANCCASARRCAKGCAMACASMPATACITAMCNPWPPSMGFPS